MNINKLGTMLCATVALAIVFIFFGSHLDMDYVIPQRLFRLAAIVLGGICVACTSIIFQTLVGNRVLTPAIMGYEAVYLLWQALLLFIFGTQGVLWLGITAQFFMGIFLMLFYSWALHLFLLSRIHKDLFQLLLFGLVFTMVLGTVTQFIQLKISPGEFSVFQGLSYASFNRVQSETLIFAVIMIVFVLWRVLNTLPILDVLSLGREQAISLGVDHHHYVKFYLALIAVLVAVSTSLIGPTAFMGVFIANIAYAIAKSYQHKFTLAIGGLVAVAIFLIAQILVEHVFNYKTTVSILINLVCGIYFLILVVRTRGVT
ncbi:iron chelate uptake ABC transporter family permease subunit [Acinetobacter bereziniae]|uniref:iron chelate uptake ABC transporter family permease subunit n=1 Tax=Acinetobacter bereziniae TaxID=106648 RepID=UPI00257818DF|nr:iron chelate uptake ABC transporter family permease subunit [Acinetobacter bereziniae]MDM1783502.1 iron chelate uptake ABC transporter family permease subunit [Acinetobacter bereziniae]